MRIALLSAALLFTASVAHAQDFDTPQISVTGEATVSVAPDLALIDAGVSSDGKTAREASEANNAAMGKVLLAIKSAGIDEKDVQTQRLSLQPVYGQRSNNGPNVVTGYRASNRVMVKLRDMARVANVIDLAIGAGANDIGGVSFTVAQPSKLMDEARAQAIADARRKAELYAKAAGVELGMPLSIAEQGAVPPPMFRRMVAARMDAAPTPVAQGEETLQVSVSVLWAIKAKAQ